MKLPTGYDAEKPYPVIFVFNPTNNPISWAEQSAGFESNGAKDAWIRVYPHPANTSNGWGAGDVSFQRGGGLAFVLDEAARRGTAH